MDRALGLSTITMLCVYAVGLAAGQILFKLAAQHGAGTGAERWLAYALNPYLLAGLILYALLTVFWVWILTFVPISVAYPFVALAFVLTLLSGVLLFQEPFSMRLIIGGALIVGGLLVITR